MIRLARGQTALPHHVRRACLSYPCVIGATVCMYQSRVGNPLPPPWSMTTSGGTCRLQRQHASVSSHECRCLTAAYPRLFPQRQVDPLSTPLRWRWLGSWMRSPQSHSGIKRPVNHVVVIASRGMPYHEYPFVERLQPVQ